MVLEFHRDCATCGFEHGPGNDSGSGALEDSARLCRASPLAYQGKRLRRFPWISLATPNLPFASLTLERFEPFRCDQSKKPS